MKRHKLNGYQYWYDRVAKVWKAAKFSPNGRKQLTNAIIKPTKEEIIKCLIGS